MMNGSMALKLSLSIIASVAIIVNGWLSYRNSSPLLQTLTAFSAGLLLVLCYLIWRDRSEQPSDRRLVESALQESEERLRLALDAAQMGIWDWDMTTDRIIWSEEHERLFGLAPGTFDGTYTTFEACVYPDDRAALQQAMKQARETHTDYGHNYRIVWADGSIHWIESKGTLYCNDAGDIVRILGTVRDISARQRAEDAVQTERKLLELRVAERTAELLQVNQRLQQELDERTQIQASLQISQARFGGILEIASDAIISVNANQHITLFNQGAEKIFGYTAEEVIGQPLDRLLPDRSVTMHRQHVSGFAQSDGRARRMGERSEIFGRRKDGSEFPAEASISRLNLGNETVFTAILRDISERKQAEESLRLSEERLQLALEGADDGLWDWKIPTGECYFSPGWLRMLGYAPGELPDHVSVWEQLIHPDDKERVMAILTAHLQDSAVPYKFDYRMGTKSGEWKWIANYGRVTRRDNNGSPLRMTGTHRDISDRKQAELASSQLAAIIDSSGDAIDSSTLDGTIISWNASAAKLYGYTSEEAIGRPISLLIPSDRLEEEDHINQTIQQEKQIRNLETLRRRKDGTLIDVALTVSPVKDAMGKIVGASAIARDITDRLQIDRMKDEFVSVVSHELRTPLTSIHGSLGMLASGLLKPDSEQGKRMLQIAVESTDRLVRLINDILDIERIESGRVKMEKEDCQVQDLFTEAVNVVQPLADKAGVTLAVTGLPMQMWADPDRIVQTLTNLLSNAIKFSPSGSTVWLTVERGSEESGIKNQDTLADHPPPPTVRLSAHDEAPHPTPFILFTVKDQGRGIPADKLETIFERFQQVDSSDSRNHEGTGLGLAICRSIVQQHGGHIWVESVLGKGSTFSFTIPAFEIQALETQGLPVEPSAAPLIMICDNDPAIRTRLQTLLEQQLYRVITTTIGEDAIAQAIAQRPDAILLDLLLPNLNGWEILSQLKQRAETQTIPIIICSISTPTESPFQATGYVDWVSKPLDESVLLQSLKQALAKPSGQVRVLIVEDDMALAKVLTALFEQHDIAAFHATTAREAIRLSQQVNPDLLVLDLVLPEGDGFTVVEWLQLHQRLREIPLVVYSGKDLDASERDRLQLGRTEFLSKGRVTIQEFEQRVMALLQRVTQSSSSQAETSQAEISQAETR